MTFRYLDVCAGISASSVAWRPLGAEPVMYSEIERFPREVLAHRQRARDLRRGPAHGRVPLFGDFSAIRPRHLRRFGIASPDVLVGGTPCQAFSFAGLRLSLADARGNLALAFVRLAHALARDPARPLRNAVWENVPGVLSTADNAFGCLLGAFVGADAPLAQPFGGRWPDVGMVAGPRARAAWRVLDAQYFGLAQRRRRVFLVVDFGNGADPAAVLFEPKGVRRNRPSRGEARENIAGTIAGGARKRGGYLSDDVPAIACTILRGGHGNNPLDETLVAHCFDARQSDVIQYGDMAGPLDTDGYSQAIAFDTTQITHPENRSNPQPGDPCHTLPSNGHAPAVALSVAIRGREGGGTAELGDDVAHALRASQGGADKPHVLTSGVRRLTPRECERLQGFEDDYTLIPIRGGVSADGPRYAALGNSMAVPCMAWIGERLAAGLSERAAA